MFATLSSPLFLTAWASGTATGLGLFAVVGAQSAFILRQGLMRAHLLSVVAICALIDAVFIFASVSGLQALTAWFPWLTTAVLWFGVAFLTWYALQSARRAWTATGGLAAARDVVPLSLIHISRTGRQHVAGVHHADELLEHLLGDCLLYTSRCV